MMMRLRGINTVRAKGRIYHYHRKTGKRIQAAAGTAEFFAEVAALDKLVSDKKPEPRPGSLGGVIAKYKASPEFLGQLAPRTRRDYQKVFDYLAPLDAMPVVEIDSAFVIGVRDKAFAKRKRRFANYVIQVLRLLFKWAKLRNYASSNPAADVELIRKPKGARIVNRAWRDEEVKAFFAEAPIELRVAVGLGYYAGVREGDLIRLLWPAYSGGAIDLRQGKTDDPVFVTAHRELRAILDEWRIWRRDELARVNAQRVARAKVPLVDYLNIVVGRRLRPFTQNGFQSKFFKFIRKLEAAGKVGKGLTFHGLRHSLGRNIADSGGDTRDIQAVLGHRTSAMAEHYSKEADQRRRAKAAIVKLERKRGGVLQNRADGGAKLGKKS